MNTKLIRIDVDDDEKLNNQCIAIYLQHHPEMIGVPITRLKMIKEVIRFYIEA